MGGVPGQQHDSTMAVSSVIMCETLPCSSRTAVERVDVFASGLKALSKAPGHAGGLVAGRRGHKRGFRCARIVYAWLVDAWAALRSLGASVRDLLSQAKESNTA